MAMILEEPISRDALDFESRLRTLVNQAQRALSKGSVSGGDLLDYLQRLGDAIVAGDELDARSPNSYFQGIHGAGYDWSAEWAALRPLLVSCGQEIHSVVPRNAQGWLMYQKLQVVGGLESQVVEPEAAIPAGLQSALQAIVNAVTVA